MIGFSNSPVKNTTCEVEVVECNGTHSISDDGGTTYNWEGYIDREYFDWTKYNYMIYLFYPIQDDRFMFGMFDLKKNENFLFADINTDSKSSEFLTDGNMWYQPYGASSLTDHYIKINGKRIEFYYRYKSNLSSLTGSSRYGMIRTVTFI